jgi:hypothetical protein
VFAFDCLRGGLGLAAGTPCLGACLWRVCCPAISWSHPNAPTKFIGLAEERAVGLRLVPHALEWRGAGGNTSAAAWRGRVSAETVRRWRHAWDWVGKRAKLTAKDNDPERVAKLARIRLLWERLPPRQALLFADALDIQLLPKSGYQWMPKGTQVEVMTPGKNQKRYLAGAWDVRTGQVHYRVWASKTNGLFRALVEAVETAYPARHDDRIYVVVDNYKIHKAQAVEQWLTAQRRVELVFLPTYCPKANPIERLFGDTHDKVTRNHTRKQIWRLVEDVKRHWAENGPWPYRLSEIYFTAAVTAAVRSLRTQAKAIA